MSEMRVTKRDGNTEDISFDKILNRVKKLGQEANIQINYSALVMKVIDQLYDKIPTTKIDELTAEQCAALSTQHPDYGVLAGRIVVSNHQKNTSPSFQQVVEQLFQFRDVKGESSPLVTSELHTVARDMANYIEPMLDYQRDYLIDYFGFKTLERSYLFKVNDKVVERPQHMWMRVAIGIHGNNLDAVKETYDLMSQKYFTHATPTLFNAGTPRPQLSSCYLIAMEDDSLDGIYNTLKDCANISKWSGGIGLHIHNIRATNSLIRGTNGKSTGIVPMLKVFNDTARFINQGGKRNGSFAIYLEPWHPDIQDFLEMKKNHGDEESKARDLFYALWIPDLFMERVKDNKSWSLFCPNECPNLSDVYGPAFKELYEQYEESNVARKIVQARDLWFRILDAQMETGTPYLLYKDACNRASNQKNLGTIKSSNLCVAPETCILTDKGYAEICTLQDQQVNVWNGVEFSEVAVRKTGEEQELMTIETSDGCTLDCTPYHKFYIQTKYESSRKTNDEKNEKNEKNDEKNKRNKHIVVVEAQNLKENDKIIKCSYPVLDGTANIEYAYTHGFFCGDGTYSNIHSDNPPTPCNFSSLLGHSYCKRHIDYETENNPFPIQTELTSYKCNGISYSKKPMISLYGEKKELLPYLQYRSVSNEDAVGRLNLCLPLDLPEKFEVPMNGSIQNKLDWFAGYCDADGTIANNGKNQQLQLSCIHKNFLLKVKWMLNTCGIPSKINECRKEGDRCLSDSQRNNKLYHCQSLYRLLITSHDLYKLVTLGFSPKRLKLNKDGSIPNRNACQFVKIKKIINTGRKDDTYCFHEPKRNSGIFNGIITSQCAEITEYSDENETAVCNLASIALPAFVNPATKVFDYEKLHEVTKVVTKNLNQIIDINFYPTTKTKKSNMLHRPIGIGVQGLADAFILMDVAFHSEEAKEINKLIFETMYHAALEKSNEMAIQLRLEHENQSHDKDQSDLQNARFFSPYSNKYSLSSQHRGSYSSFENSPASKGILQFDMWSVTPTERYNWATLKQSIIQNGLRNSLLIALMPTASTSQILGYNECFEPLTSNIYSRRTLAGEFVVANHYLMRELIEIGIWNEDIKNNIIANKGSIQQLTMIPEHIRNKYKIVWEMPMKHLIDMSADRGAFICQSQSLNLWLEDPNYNTLTSMHFYSWKQGLKTGIYYLRRKAKHQAQQFTVEPEKKQVNETDTQHDICESCSA